MPKECLKRTCVLQPDHDCHKCPSGEPRSRRGRSRNKEKPCLWKERLLLERNYAKNSLVCFKCDCNMDTWRMRCQKSYSRSCSKGWKSAIGELCLVIYNNEMLWSSGEETHTSNQSDNLTIRRRMHWSCSISCQIWKQFPKTPWFHNTAIRELPPGQWPKPTRSCLLMESLPMAGWIINQLYRSR